MKIKIYETVKNKNDILTLERFNSMLSYASGPNGEKAVYISGGNLAANSIYGASIVAKSLTAEQIKAESITADLIKAGSITTSHITAGGIDAQVIKTGILKSIVDPLTIGSLINLDTGDLSLAGGNLTWNSSKKEFYINANRITIGGNNLLTEKTDLAKMINDDPNTTVIDGKKLHFTSDVKMDNAYITKLTTNDLFMENVNSYSVNANRINSGSLSANFISGGTIDANDVSIVNLNASNITSGTIDANDVSVINLNASSITSGTINADTISVINLDASNITTGIMDANTVSIVNLNASSITSGTIDASRISVTNLNASNIKSGTIDASLISVINLDASNITTGSLDIAQGFKLMNGTQPIIQANNKGEIEMNVSKLSINALPVATEESVEERINNIELTPGPVGKSSYTHTAYANLTQAVYEVGKNKANINSVTIPKKSSKTINHITEYFKFGQTYTVSFKVDTSDKNLFLVDNIDLHTLDVQAGIKELSKPTVKVGQHEPEVNKDMWVNYKEKTNEQ